ncbi:hypothetical protein AX14_009746 [Amanita brunnescens Koide BX004]|nr:hypothetical protein AX14_009746 [Amanita brunnescens Koide BX004]
MFYEERQKSEYCSSGKSKEASNMTSAKPRPTEKSRFQGTHRKTDKKPIKAAKPFKPIGASDRNIICYHCKNKGHYSTACLYNKHIKKAYAAAPDGLSLGDIRQICAKTQEEEEVSSEEYDDLDEYDEEPSEDEEDDNDELSLNDWAGAARAYNEDNEDEDGEIVYNEPYPVNGDGLQNWSDMAGHMRLEDTLLSQDIVNADVICYSSAVCLLDEEEYIESSKINDAATEQVAYRQRATKDLGPHRIEDSPKHDFKHLGVIEGYM